MFRAGRYLPLPRVSAFAAAAAGAGLFVGLGLPLPMLLGPMIGCLIAALARLPLQDLGGLGALMRTFIGVAVGCSITPQALAEMPRFAFSLAFVPLYVVVIGAIGYSLFRRLFGFDHPTAWYGAMPGGLQDMLAFGIEAGGDARALSLIHATRVLVLVTVAPLILSQIWAVDLTRAPGQAMGETALSDLGLMLFAAVAGWKIAERLRLFGASILGPMIVAACLSLTGLIHSRPPAEVIWAAQFFLGQGVGAKYAGITWAELKRDVGAGIVYALMLAAVSLLFIEVLFQTSIAPGLEAFLAFVPGGQAEMVVIAIIAGADLGFVVCHHLLRMVLVIILAPVFAKMMGGRGGGRGASPPRTP